MKYYNLDLQFINAIEQRTRVVGDVDDQDLNEAFSNYTQLMIDLALISEDLFTFDPKIKELVQIYEQRINFMKKTYLF